MLRGAYTRCGKLLKLIFVRFIGVGDFTASKMVDLKIVNVAWFCGFQNSVTFGISFLRVD